MLRKFIAISAGAILMSSSAMAVENAEVIRVDAETVLVRWQDADPVDIMVSDTAQLARGNKPIVKASRTGEATVPMPASKRGYIILRDGGDKRLTVAAERELPLEKGSNFRDLGGYKGEGGRALRWGKIYRSGALPVISETDYALLGGLGIGSIIDLRSLEEREVAGTLLDDRTGALFVANDYALAPLFASFAKGNGENVYSGMEKLLAPQYRSIFNRLLADDGAVMFNCSAGQDRTGIASALVLSALGVERDVILKDFHLSTALRRPQNELPPLDAAKHPNNPIVQYYAAAAKKPGGIKAEPLYSKAGISHLKQFFEHIDREYGSVEGYLEAELNITAADIKKLHKLYLE
ncbi:MAG: tyrosine-protein phosphatase [Sphingorhabdus sp.]|nr:tyrosine-protein phosphatase [Sphingorhabdus sp.]